MGQGIGLRCRTTRAIGVDYDYLDENPRYMVTE